jgi:hypothetical protein
LVRVRPAVMHTILQDLMQPCRGSQDATGALFGCIGGGEEESSLPRFGREAIRTSAVVFPQWLLNLARIAQRLRPNL